MSRSTPAIQADITHRTNRYGDQIGNRLAVTTDALARLAREVSEGDSVTVEYVSGSGLDVAATGRVTAVEGRDATEGNTVDIRFGGCYLHLNADTGDYYFQDSGRERPEDGREVRSIALRMR